VVEGRVEGGGGCGVAGKSGRMIVKDCTIGLPEEAVGQSIDQDARTHFENAS